MKSGKLFARTISTVAVIFVVLTLGCLTAFAQTGTASIRGTVRDPQGNVVSGAKVTVSNQAKNFSRTQVTGDDGSYSFTALAPDTYSVDAEAAGFKKSNVSDVRAQVDTTKDLDITLEVGQVTETITVISGTEATLNSTDASIGSAFESRRIQELPLNARNIVGLLSLQPGVTREGEVNGSRRDQANITLDGIDVNEQQTGLDVVNGTNRATNVQGDAFASVLRMTPDSVQEFRVTTSNPNSTQGRSSGGQVTLVTKSGTNDFHGSLFEYHRNTITTSNDYFNNARGRFVATDPEVISGEKQVGDERVPRPKLIRNIFGGTLGGPIKKNRAYFFYSFEGRRDAAEESVVRDVPTATLRQGTVRYRCIVDAINNPLCPASGIRTLTPADIAGIYPATGGVNLAGLAILQTAPLPNDFSTGDGLNRAGFRFNAPISVELETHTARFDVTLTDRQSIFARGNYQNDLYGRAPRFPTTPAPNVWVNPRGFVVGHTWTLTNSLVNNARVGLTRAGVTQQGDSTDNSIGFRDVYVPFTYARGLQRTTPVWNLTDDLSWVKGSHTIQFGTNMRFIRNDRTSFANSFDAALVNFSFYASSGSSILNPAPGDRDPSFNRDFGTAVAAVLGRYSQYSIRANFDKSGQPLPAGSPAVRSLATQEYDFYAQDIWKVTPNLTLNFGLRYGQETPVYEVNGFQLVPNTNLGQFLQRRIEGAANGTPLNETISFNLGGRANNAPDFYNKDKNNFAPHIGVAWSPDFGDNFFGRLIGRNGRSVFRGGFRILYDHIAGQLAVDAENENSFGFAAENTNGSSSTNTTTLLGPLVSGFNPNVRSFPRVTLPASLTFPLSFPADETDRIVAGLDQSIVSPKHYTWNFSYGRELGKGLSFEASYIGRKAENLLLVRDIMQLNNLRDPQSGQDWYGAAGQLNDLRRANTPLNAVPNIPFFTNLFPNLGDNLLGDPTLTPSQAAFILHSADPNFGFNITDFTLIQIIIDDLGRVPNAFFHPQYAALTAFSSVGRSWYHGGAFSVRQRLGNDFIFDLNYTLAKSMDNGSTLLSQRALSNTVRNALDPDLEYSVSDFDVRHNVNANWLWALPFGRGKRWMGGSNSLVNGILGGWQLTGIFRFNSGLPTGSPSDVEWATNWQLTSNGVRTGQPLAICHRDVAGVPNVFCNPTTAYQSFRNARAGEVGDRNIDELRLPSYISLDAGLSKSFKMWYAEGHQLQFRWEVFNVTNTQRFGVIDALSLNPDPFLSTQPSASFGNYIGSQTPVGETRPGRVMQFALRYTF